MIEDKGSIKEIDADELQQADIFLCVQQEESAPRYTWLALNMIAELARNKGKISDYQYYLPLVKLMIRVLDQNIYYHAAYFSGEKVYEEHSKDGLCENSLSTYKEEVTDVFRFVTDTNATLDTEGQRLIEARARYLLDTVGKEGPKGYSFQNCGVLLALCLVRIGGPNLVGELEKKIRHHFEEREGVPAFLESVLNKLFNKENENKLVGWLLSYARHMLSPYWQEGSMVCSQFVANCFSHADDKATYRIEKPTRPIKTDRIDHQCTSQTHNSENVSIEDEQAALETLDQNLLSLMMPPLANDATDWDEIARKVNLDDMYTPADFALSPNTRYMGRLKL